MDTYEIDHGEHPADVRYDMGLTAYPLPPPDPVGTGNSYHDYEWGVLPDGTQSSVRSMYPGQDVMEPQYGSYALGYAPLPPTADLGVMTAMQTYIPPSEISFSTPLSHMQYQGHENYYGSTFNTISPTSTTSSTSSGSDGRPSQKAKRKRVQSTVQRKAANVRERRRMYHLNEAFDELRKRLPAFNYEKRLSRIETLKLAMTYIGFMKGVSDGKDPKDVKLIQQITSDFSDNESD